jgi:hypothetical protein
LKKYLFIVLLIGVWSCEDESEICDNTISDDAKTYADNNWSLQNWYNFTQLVGVQKLSHNGKSISNSMFNSMGSYTGFYHLTLQLSGELLSEIPNSLGYISSDSLHLLTQYLNTSDVQVIKDSNFYNYIGEYGQFLGGWLDSGTDWYYEEEDVGDSILITIKTPKKQEYLEMLPNCN